MFSHSLGQSKSDTVRADLDDSDVAAWTHNLTADQTTVVIWPELPHNPFVFSLTGTTRTIEAMAKGIQGAGIVGLPAPWGANGQAQAMP